MTEFKRTKTPYPKTIKRHSRGRPTLFGTKIDMEQIEKLIMDGWTDKKIIDFLGIEKNVWYTWKKDHPEIQESVDWRRAHDHLIERKLSEVARGYSHPEEKVFLGPGGQIVTHETTKHYPPNVSAIQFWLTNRQKNDWRHQQSLALTGANGGPVEIASKPKKISLSDFSEEELALITSAGRKLSASKEEEEPPEAEEL